jgi:hypothetical protein
LPRPSIAAIERRRRRARTGQNLLLWSEDLSNPAWTVSFVVVTTNQANDLAGQPTLDQLHSTGAAFIGQNCTVVPGQTYCFSFEAKNNAGTTARYSLYDITNSAYLVAPTSYFGSLGGSPVRVSVSTTVPGSCTMLRVGVLDEVAATAEIFAGRAQVNVGTVPVGYVTTTTSTAP